MANNKKDNRYKKQATKKKFMQQISSGLQTKGNVKNTLLETGKDLLVGVIGGGLVGSAIGKASLGVGALVAGAGHYADNKLATVFGIGMMAANGFQQGKSVSGLDGLDGVQERVQAYKETFSEKLFLDKIIPKKVLPMKGMGEVQYFTHPDEAGVGSLSALDYIENQITESGLQQMQRQSNPTPDYTADIAGIYEGEILM